MSLLAEIQAAVVEDNSDLGPILLKLRLLAARLGSQPLADWVKHESEGYPTDAPLPDYRVIPASYRGTFFGPFGASISNAPIPSFLIAKFAGDKWNDHEIRQGIASIDELLASSANEGTTISINASNLVLLLQGKIYEDYACNSVTGTLSRASLAGLRHAVRSRVLELTIELEKSVPGATDITMQKSEPAAPASSAAATQITNQIIYGNHTSNNTSITSSGDGTQVNVAIGKGDASALMENLKAGGIPEKDATELANLIVSEQPESKQGPLGTKARKWLVENLKKGAGGTWKAGVSVATEVIKKAALQYYGL